jgi:hypothetical protein
MIYLMTETGTCQPGEIPVGETKWLVTALIAGQKTLSDGVLAGYFPTLV